MSSVENDVRILYDGFVDDVPDSQTAAILTLAVVLGEIASDPIRVQQVTTPTPPAGGSFSSQTTPSPGV